MGKGDVEVELLDTDVGELIIENLTAYISPDFLLLPLDKTRRKEGGGGIKRSGKASE